LLQQRPVKEHSDLGGVLCIWTPRTPGARRRCGTMPLDLGWLQRQCAGLIFSLKQIPPVLVAL
jgi:hypothetical protein